MADGFLPRELQLMPKPPSAAPPRWVAGPAKPNSPCHPHLDLNLSIGAKPFGAFSNEEAIRSPGSVEALRWQTAEQNRLAAVEKAYAEQVRELTRKEMEMAEQEFKRARIMWERTREEMEKAEKMREMATSKKATFMGGEITCRACRQRFKP